MTNKTKKGMMSRFFEDDLPSPPSPAPLASPKPSKPLSGMDVLNKAMDVLGTDTGPLLVEISSIGVDPKNKRALSAAEFKRLKDSIQADGLFNPITVRKAEGSGFAYMAVAGHNRLQAMKDLGHRSVPVNVVDLKDDGAKAAFISNLLQPELGIAEIFEGLKILRLGQGEHKSVRQLAADTGFSTAYISQVLSMDQLPSELVLAMKHARVRVGSNVLKGFVNVLSDKQADRQQLIDSARQMIESTAAQVSALSPTLSKAENLHAGSGEDSNLKSWQKALTAFTAKFDSKSSAPSPIRSKKVDLKGWALSGAVRRKNSVVLNFDDEAEAELFMKFFEKSRSA